MTLLLACLLLLLSVFLTKTSPPSPFSLSLLLLTSKIKAIKFFRQVSMREGDMNNVGGRKKFFLNSACFFLHNSHDANRFHKCWQLLLCPCGIFWLNFRVKSYFFCFIFGFKKKNNFHAKFPARQFFLFRLFTFFYYATAHCCK